MSALDAKYVDEVITVKFDFTSRLLFGDTLSAPVVTVSVRSGVDDAPENILSGSASVSGLVVSQKIQVGSPGVIYDLLCEAAGSPSSIVYGQARVLAIIPTTGPFGVGHGLAIEGTLTSNVCDDDEYLSTLTIIDGYQPYTIVMTGAPIGWTVLTDGNIIQVEGIADEAGSFDIVITLTDAIGNVAIFEQTVVVNACSQGPFYLIGFATAAFLGPDREADPIPVGTVSSQDGGVLEQPMALSSGYLVVSSSGSNMLAEKLNDGTGVYDAYGLTGGTVTLAFTLSPDGAWLVSTGYNGSVPTRTMRVYQNTGSEFNLVHTYVTAIHAPYIKFSPSGTKVAISTMVIDDNTEIWTFNPTTGVMASLGLTGYGGWELAWSPNDAYLSLGRPDLVKRFVINAVTFADIDFISASGGNRSGACFNKDGTLLFYSSNNFGAFGVASFDGTDLVHLADYTTGVSEGVSRMDLSLDGDLLMVVSYGTNFGAGYAYNLWSIDNSGVGPGLTHVWSSAGGGTASNRTGGWIK